jgi:multidrug efflux pump subunit AcrB
MVNDGLVLIGKFNSNLVSGLSFDVGLREAGKSRFRAIFLTSLTTIAGLSTVIIREESSGTVFKANGHLHYFWNWLCNNTYTFSPACITINKQ